MSEKLKNLIKLKNDIDNLSKSFKFNMEFEKENLIVDLNENGQWEKTDHIIESSMMKGVPIYDGIEGYTIVIFYGPKYGRVNTHTHDYDEVLLCLEGKFRYIKNENEHIIVNPFESVYIKKDMPHNVELLEDSKILTIWNPNE
jgi:quercetin dioxygenase-like cupin family protein